MKMRPQLTDRELEIMKIVWRLGDVSVRDVYEQLEPASDGRRRAYTTVMTLMKILDEKGYLEKELDGRAFIYSAREPEKVTIGRMVNQFLERVFDGSAQPLLLTLVEQEELTLEQLEELRARTESMQPSDDEEVDR